VKPRDVLAGSLSRGELLKQKVLGITFVAVMSDEL
jgi:hypothetical protein